MHRPSRRRTWASGPPYTPPSEGDLALLQPFGSAPSVEAYLDDGWRRDGCALGYVAQDAGGSQVLTWRYPGLVGPEPVVFLGDGTLGVVASDLQQFVRMLGAGYTCAGGW
ncbi:MAG: hypothetical protein ABMB14_28305 [Myxococcota bacterium]